MVTFFKYSLLAIFPLACYTIWYTALTDGATAIMISEIFPKGELPGKPKVRWKERYTGIYALDQSIIGFVVYYWPIVSGESPSMVLQFISSLGVLGSGWLLALLEACRTQPFSQWIRRMTIMMTAAMLLGYGIAFPVYLALSLKAVPWQDNSASANFIFIQHIPEYFVLSYILPSILMLLPAPEAISFDTKQQLTALFQLTHIFLAAMVVSTWIWHRGRSSRITHSQAAITAKQRSACIFAIALSAFTHILVVILSLPATLGFSPVYPDDGHADLLSVLLPPLRWRTPNSFSKGVLLQMQWDYVWGALAVFLWGMALHVQGMQRANRPISYSRLLVKATTLSVVVGVSGAVAVLILERDEMVKQGSEPEKDE